MKEKFYQLIKDCGFKSMREFSRECGVMPGNIVSNVNGTYKLSIERAFIYADTLKVPITTILNIFYPEEMERNRKHPIITG